MEGKGQGGQGQSKGAGEALRVGRSKRCHAVPTRACRRLSCCPPRQAASALTRPNCPSSSPAPPPPPTHLVQRGQARQLVAGLHGVHLALGAVVVVEVAALHLVPALVEGGSRVREGQRERERVESDVAQERQEVGRGEPGVPGVHVQVTQRQHRARAGGGATRAAAAGRPAAHQPARRMYWPVAGLPPGAFAR